MPMKPLNRPVLLLAAVLASCAGASADLAAYVGKNDQEFRWTKGSESTVGAVKVVNLKVQSLVWRGIPWSHTVQLFIPPAMKHPKTALLLITGGDPGLTGAALGTAFSQQVEAPVAVLYNIPNQPLLGMREDDLIAHTFQEYLKSGDDSWVLLFPMTKSAVRAMDAVQAYSRQELAAPIEDFVVTGASKRGWTTWLTAASDKRVKGIAPMVFDNLNFAKQMPRQLELWGKYSEQIEDYSRRGLQQKMDTPEGRKLTSMVDPWFYRRSLTMPKLLINGANDRYWSTDSTRLYWDDLAGEKYLLSIPNAGHGLEDRARLLGSMAAFFHAVAAGKELPKLSHTQSETGGKARLTVRSNVKPVEVRLWVARAPDLDFRPVKWESQPMTASGETYTGEIDLPSTGGAAVFAEAAYEIDGRRFTLSTPSTVYGKRQ